jgi:hypothetical protein
VVAVLDEAALSNVLFTARFGFGVQGAGCLGEDEYGWLVMMAPDVSRVLAKLGARA